MQAEKSYLIKSATLAGASDDANVDFTLDPDTKGIRVIVSADLVGTVGDATFDVKLQRYDPFVGYVDITGAAIAQKTTDAVVDLLVYPGATAVTNLVVNQPLAANTLRAVVAIAGTYDGGEGWTYKIAVQELP